MTPGPNLQELIDTIRRDASSEDALAQLATASTTVTQLSDTGDAALGYFVDRARTSGHSWVEISNVLGVSKQAAHKRFSISWTRRPDFERFTDRARHVLEAAPGIALLHNHAYTGTEHLLRAFYVEPHSVAAKLLTARGITEAAVEEAVQAQIPDGESRYEGEPPLTPRAANVLQLASAEAVELGHDYVGTEHILLGLYRDSGGVAAKVLRQLGLDDEAAKAGVVEALSS